MQTLDEIRKQIKNIQGLKSIVRTMKVLASVSIRQYEKAAHSLSEYNRTTELGLQVVLDHFTDSRPKADGSARKKWAPLCSDQTRACAGSSTNRSAHLHWRNCGPWAMPPQNAMC
jgi:hypothetical protein